MAPAGRVVRLAGAVDAAAAVEAVRRAGSGVRRARGGVAVPAPAPAVILRRRRDDVHVHLERRHDGRVIVLIPVNRTAAGQQHGQKQTALCSVVARIRTEKLGRIRERFSLNLERTF